MEVLVGRLLVKASVIRMPQPLLRKSKLEQTEHVEVLVGMLLLDWAFYSPQALTSLSEVEARKNRRAYVVSDG